MRENKERREKHGKVTSREKQRLREERIQAKGTRRGDKRKREENRGPKEQEERKQGNRRNKEGIEEIEDTHKKKKQILRK